MANAGNSSSHGLTVGKMMQRHPKEQVEEAMFRRNYLEGRQQSIRVLEEQIEAGLYIETCREGLANILRIPPGPPIDSNEPADLDQNVMWRMRVLKHLRDFPPEHDGLQRPNSDVILNAYRSRQLLRTDLVSVWYAGHLIAGPMSRNDLDLDSIFARFQEWEEIYGSGYTWVESSMSNLDNAAVLPCNRFSQWQCSGVSAECLFKGTTPKGREIRDS